MVGLFKRKKNTPVVMQNVKVTLEEGMMSQQKESTYRFNLFNEGNNLLLYGNLNGSSSKFFNRLIQQEYKQYPDLTSVVFTTSLEYYQELIDSNISTVIYSLSEFTLNPFNTFGEFVGENDDSRYQAEAQAMLQVETLIRNVVEKTGNDKMWTQQHSVILSYKIQELIRNSKKTPAMLDLYTVIYKEFLEIGDNLTETFENIKTLDALQSEIIEALDPFTEKKTDVLKHFEILRKYQIYQDVLVVLSNFIRFESYSEFFSAETKLPLLDDKKVVIIEVPKNYGESHAAAIALLTEFLTQSNVSTEGERFKVKGRLAIYQDIQCTDHSSLSLRTLRRCRRCGVGIRINTIYKLSQELMCQFSKHAVVQSEHLRKHHVIEPLHLNEEEWDIILSLKDGESFVLHENYLLDENWIGKRVKEDVARMSN